MTKAISHLTVFVWLFVGLPLLFLCLPGIARAQDLALINMWVRQRPTHPDSPEEKQLEEILQRANTALQTDYNYPVALEHLHNGFRAAEKAGNLERQYEFLVGLAFCVTMLGDYDNALTYADKAERIVQKLNLTDQMPWIHYGRGWIHLVRGDFIEALERFKKMRSYTGKRYDSLVAYSLVGTASFYYQMGRYQEAQNDFERAFPIAPPDLKPMCLVGAGWCYVNRGKYDDARKSLQLAELFATDDNDRALLHLGKGLLCVFRALRNESPASPQSDDEVALNEFAPAIEHYHKQKENYYEGYARGGTALALCGLGRYQEALEQIKQAVNLRVAPAAHDLLLLNAVQALIYRGQGDFDSALRCTQSMVQALETEEAGQANTVIAMALQDIAPNPYANMAYVLQRLGRTEEALLTAERGRGRGLGKQAAQNLRQFLFSQQDRERWKQATIAFAAADLRNNKLQKQLPEYGEHAPESLKGRAEQAEREAMNAQQTLKDLEDEIDRNPAYTEYTRILGRTNGSIEELYALADQHPQTLYLELVAVDRDTSLLFALAQHRKLKGYVLHAGSVKLLQLVSQWRAAIRATGPLVQLAPSVIAQNRQLALQEPGYARALYDLLLEEPNADHLLSGQKHLVFVTGGALSDAPLMALRDPEGKRLTQRYTVAQSVSLRELTWHDSPREAKIKPVLCIADSLGPQERRFQDRLLFLDQVVPLPHPAAKGAGNDGNDRTGIAFGRGGLGPLKYARAQGETERERRATVLLGPDKANKARVLQEMPLYAVLIFAVHGIANPNFGLLSHLVLSPDGPNDAYCATLSAEEIMRLHLAAQLVILSACESAEGETIGNEGLLGLAWAFRAAGCPTVVGSLWQVDDRATQILMGILTHLLRPHGGQAGMRVDEALQKAIAQLRSQHKEYDTPYYWSAFQIYGAAGPVPIWAGNAH